MIHSVTISQDLELIIFDKQSHIIALYRMHDDESVKYFVGSPHRTTYIESIRIYVFGAFFTYIPTVPWNNKIFNINYKFGMIKKFIFFVNIILH